MEPLNTPRDYARLVGYGKTMNVQALLDQLNSLLEAGELTPEDPVLFLQQPSWPFVYGITDAIAVEVSDEEDAEPAEDEDDEGDYPADLQHVLVLVENEQIAYAPGFICEAAGWRR